jgi:hypothetical protein
MLMSYVQHVRVVIGSLGYMLHSLTVHPHIRGAIFDLPSTTNHRGTPSALDLESTAVQTCQMGQFAVQQRAYMVRGRRSLTSGSSSGEEWRWSLLLSDWTHAPPERPPGCTAGFLCPLTPRRGTMRERERDVAECLCSAAVYLQGYHR